MTIAPPAPPTSAPQPPVAPPSARKALPVWLRTPPRQAVKRRPAPTPRDIRWWVGVIWMLASALAVGMVAHVTIVGSLQHARSQHVLYQDLRTDLAKAEAPVGQLDFDDKLVANGTPIALLEIEAIGVEEVVVQGTTPTDLVAGPGHRRDTVYPGQDGLTVIMARQATYGGPFSGIVNLEPGDEIRITTGQGVAVYEVFGTRQEGDLLPVPLKEGMGRLMLVTADGTPLTPSGALYVDAALTSKVQETPAPSFSIAVLDASELEMATDEDGWFETLFWLQWLTVAAVALRWARSRWGTWQIWVVALPVMLFFGAASAGAAMTMLPNLL